MLKFINDEVKKMTICGILIDEDDNYLTVSFTWPSDFATNEESIEEFLEAFNSSNIYIEFFDGDTGNLESKEIKYDADSQSITMKFINK